MKKRGQKKKWANWSKERKGEMLRVQIGGKKTKQNVRLMKQG